MSAKSNDNIDRLLQVLESYLTDTVKYFPDGDLLNAKLKKGSSFTWQSIMSRVHTLKRGHI